MTRVLMIGTNPDAVDFSDPALRPGMDAAKIRAGIENALHDFHKRGWEAELFLIQPDDAPGAIASAVVRKLRGEAFDCAVIGGGVRLPPKMLLAFEAIVNAVRTEAPQTALAFNTRPEDSGDAAARWVK